VIPPPRSSLPRLGLLGLVATCLATQRPVQAAADQEEDLVVGFTAAHFVDINRADALAAMKVWIETVIGSRGFPLKARTVVYDGVASLTAALESGTPDLVILLTPEYVALRDRKFLDPQFVSVRGMSIGESYLVVSKKDSGLGSLADLRGRRLVAKIGARMSMAEYWLEHCLAEAGQPALRDVCEAVEQEKNVSRTVLPVFFGKVDACLVSTNGFALMCELNPQLRRRLAPVAVSPCLVPSVTCLRTEYKSKYRADVVEALGELHEEPRGQQILSLFGVDRLVPFDSKCLDTATVLLAGGRAGCPSDVAP
jgi:ABC-type phosphate/phosphonate transport system substrate-binding protein